MSRQVYYAESLGEATTTSGTYQDKTTLTFTPDANKDYILFWSCDCIAASTTDDVFTRLYNSTDAVVLSEQNQENRTTAGTPYRTAHGIAKYSAGSSPASTSFKIQYYSETGTVTSKIKNARLLAVRVESADQYAESLSDQTTTSNTYVDGATLTFTPATQGDYLVFASCDWNHASTSDLLYLQLLDPSSASICEMQTHQRDATNYNPWTAMVKQNLTASSKTYKIQVHRTSANTITLRNQRIFAMRLDSGVTNAYYAEDRTQASTGSTSYQDDNSLTQSTSAADHLIFNNAFVNSSNSGISVASQFLEDGSAIQGVFEARQNATGGNNNYYPLFIAYKKTLTAASHTWKRQYKINSAGFTAYIDEDATAVIEYTTGNAYTLTCDNGSFTLSGQAVTLKQDNLLTCGTGTFTLTGQSVALNHGYKVTLDYGAFALSGQAVTLKKASLLTATYGAFTLSGQAVTLKASRTLAMNNGSFALNGQAVTFALGKGITINNGSFVLSGQNVGLIKSSTLLMNNGSFTLTGQDAALTKDSRLVCEYGAFALSGQDVTLTYNSTDPVLTAETGSYTLTGYDVTFTYDTVTPTPEPTSPPTRAGGGGGWTVHDEIEREQRRNKKKRKRTLEEIIADIDAPVKQPEPIIIKPTPEPAKPEPVNIDLEPVYQDLARLAELSQMQAAIEQVKAQQLIDDEDEAIAILLLTMH